MKELPPQYNPQAVEEPRYQWWESRGLFQADPDPKKRPYTIVIPPPNVTGILHMGHALNNTIQDILIRFKRMQGYNALWVPGTDHAGIATQNVVERALAKEGKTRQDLGRDAFIQRVWQWKEQYGNTIIYQLKRLGASCDWRRTRFTMDEGLSEAVLEVFLKLYDAGLIYRGNYIVNWCPRCQTALSDEEAPRQQTQGKLYHLKYPLEGQPGTFLEVATTRPETMLGDTAIAVHPKDPRYKALIGKRAVLPLVNRPLPIIADDVVDMAFGTGAVKVTPAHDPVDFQLGKRHQLEFLNVMTGDAHMINVPKPYEGLDRFDCRSKLIVDLEQQGFLGPIDEHQHNVGHCYRCHTAIEPRLSPQWFVKMKPLAEPAIKAVKAKTIRFLPDRWTKVYLNWMENIEDWCISRQIWWGHRLPVYYCQSCPEGKNILVAKTRPAQCPSCKGDDLKQDEDVLDTWFSSWLWPFSTLGWPKRTKELAHFYPTNTLVTAQEIIFFWVARMIMAGYFCMKRPPFTRVYIHGTVRDMTGKKMSKSLGNIIDPLEIIKQYGTDALRYTLVTSTAIGQDIFLSEERFTAGRNFANKLWNATRFALAQPEAGKQRAAVRPDTVPDRWILSRLQRTIARVTDSLEACLFNDAAGALYDFLWHDCCDWYLEIAKIQRGRSREILLHVLETSFRLLHPVMPFVTEELWQHLRPAAAKSQASIMTAAWPKPSKRLIDDKTEEQFELFKKVITAIREKRAEWNISNDRKIPTVWLVSKNTAIRDFLGSQQALLKVLAEVNTVTPLEPKAFHRQNDVTTTILDGVQVVIPMGGLIDVDKERARLQQRVNELMQHVSRLEARLADPQFTGKAPKEVIEGAEQSLAQARETLKAASEHLAVLQAM